MAAIPDGQRFKAGSDRRYSGTITRDGSAVDLTAMTGVVVKVREQLTGEVTDLAADDLTAAGGFTCDVSALASGTYWLEVWYTDPGTGRTYRPPEDLDTPGLPIEVFVGVG